MPTTVKISQLPPASNSDITPASDVLPIIDGDTTKKITVENLFIAAGTAISGNLIPIPNANETTSSFSLGSETSAWKDLYISDGTIFLQKGDGTRSTFNKQDVDDLKAGKSISSNSKQVANKLDNTTYVRMNVAGKAYHYASGVPLIQLQTSSFGLGSTNVPMTLEASSLIITGSTLISGSFESTGSFAVGNLLDLLANYGQTGIPTGSGEGGVSVGDINLDGQVNVTDLLLLLAGYGNPNIICNDLIIPPNTNYQLNGPKITISQSISVTVGTNSDFSIT